MHQVELSDATFTRLQKLAVPLVDSIESVINRIAAYYEDHHAPQVAPASEHKAAPAKKFNGTTPPDLTHTKVLSVRLAGQPIKKNNWNGALFETIGLLKDRINSSDEARRFIIVNFVKGKKEDEGYKFLPELDISVQGQDANAAWKGASHIARQLGISLDVEFLWRNKEQAAFPGETGCLSV